MKNKKNNFSLKPKNKKGNILIENILFLILNLIFLSILILFVISKSGNIADMEEKQAKQIAMIINNAKPGMEFQINMKAEKEKAEKEKYTGNLIFIQDNIVTVKLREKGGYSYSFFNDVEITKPYEILDSETGKLNGYYYFKVKEK